MLKKKLRHANTTVIWTFVPFLFLKWVKRICKLRVDTMLDGLAVFFWEKLGLCKLWWRCLINCACVFVFFAHWSAHSKLMTGMIFSLFLTQSCLCLDAQSLLAVIHLWYVRRECLVWLLQRKWFSWSGEPLTLHAWQILFRWEKYTSTDPKWKTNFWTFGECLLTI